MKKGYTGVSVIWGYTETRQAPVHAPDGFEVNADTLATCTVYTLLLGGGHVVGPNGTAALEGASVPLPVTTSTC